ncbi:DUF6612 family protein [Caldalkalibacillus mannanilyticus]|uniref:DUF6612 family protein n=1 Tax=Caldalkalibacillus mannanilyticus TaxID=1418 RepID=UPI000A99BBAD|nr:DUF6612 family protein [Caldalkalibacillus mannanilyticus]
MYQEQLEAKEVLEKSIEAMSDVKSFSMEMDMHSVFSAGEMTMEMETKSEADMFIEPLKMYQKMEMKDLTTGQTTPVEMYFTEEGIYFYDAQSQQWTKFPEEMSEYLLQMTNAAQQDPAKQLEQLQQFADDFTFTKEGDNYILTLTSTDEKFKALLNDQLDGSFAGGMMGDALEQMQINKIHYKIVLDSKTFYQKELEMDMDMTMTIEGETMEMKQSLKGKIHNYNKVAEIVVPEDVIKNAVEMQ